MHVANVKPQENGGRKKNPYNSFFWVPLRRVDGFGTCVAVFRGTIGPTVKHGLVVHKINWLDVYLTVRSIVSFCANRYSHNLETYITLCNGKRNSKLTMFTLTTYVLFRF